MRSTPYKQTLDKPRRSCETDPMTTLTAASLLTGKTRIRVGGRHSTYRLINGWYAHRIAPENGWARSARWSVYLSRAEFEAHRSIGGGTTLLSALDSTIRFSPVLNPQPQS